MWQVRRILVVMGSHESAAARRLSHRQALDTLRRVPSDERWEVAFLDLIPAGHYEFPTEIAENDLVTGDAFTRFEATEVLRSVRLDFAWSFLLDRPAMEMFGQLVRDLNLPSIATPGQPIGIERPRRKMVWGHSLPMSVFHRLSHIYPN